MERLVEVFGPPPENEFEEEMESLEPPEDEEGEEEESPEPGKLSEGEESSEPDKNLQEESEYTPSLLTRSCPTCLTIFPEKSEYNDIFCPKMNGIYFYIVFCFPNSGQFLISKHTPKPVHLFLRIHRQKKNVG